MLSADEKQERISRYSEMVRVYGIHVVNGVIHVPLEYEEPTIEEEIEIAEDRRGLSK